MQARRLWIQPSKVPGKERRWHEKTGDVGRIQEVRGEEGNRGEGRGDEQREDQGKDRQRGGEGGVKGRWRRVNKAGDT